MMRDADRPIGRLRKPPLPSARRIANEAPPVCADDEPDIDTQQENNHRPARGIVLGLAPALLLWAGLIALFTKLTR